MRLRLAVTASSSLLLFLPSSDHAARTAGRSLQLPAPMTEGIADEIQYRAQDTVKRTASLTDMDVHAFPWPWVTDPQWHVVEMPPSTNHSDTDELGYLTSNGIYFQAKLHCTSVGGSVGYHCWMEHDAPGDHHCDYRILFMDWSSNLWIATIVPPADNRFPAKPKFHLWRYPLSPSAKNSAAGQLAPFKC